MEREESSGVELIRMERQIGRRLPSGEGLESLERTEE